VSSTVDSPTSESTTPLGDRHRGIVGPILVVGALQALILVAGYGLAWLYAQGVDCPDGNCEPQYFFVGVLLLFFVLLPGTYLIGCVGVVVAVARRTRKDPQASGIVWHVAAAMVALTVALAVGYVLLLATDDGDQGPTPLVIWLACLVLGPVTVALATGLISRRRSQQPR
jgi:hypothetical protein